MNAKHIRISLVAACVAAFSTGALAHEEYAEYGPSHWVRHVAEAKTAPEGQFGPRRSDPEEFAAPKAAGTVLQSQQFESPFRALGGIGGKGTN